ANHIESRNPASRRRQSLKMDCRSQNHCVQQDPFPDSAARSSAYANPAGRISIPNGKLLAEQELGCEPSILSPKPESHITEVLMNSVAHQRSTSTRRFHASALDGGSFRHRLAAAASIGCLAVASAV